jgi:ribosome biogenesis protein UTP30
MDPRQNPVCLLVKDPQREYKDLLEEKKIKFISRVVGMEKLQGKASPAKDIAHSATKLTIFLSHCSSSRSRLADSL